jgi:hypothetical protein
MAQAAAPILTAMYRQVMEHLRSREWKTVHKLPVPVSPNMLERTESCGWIERRGDGPQTEIRLTPAGLTALRAPI